MQNLLKGISLILFGIAIILVALVNETAHYFSVDLTVVMALIGLVVSVIGLTFTFNPKNK